MLGALRKASGRGSGPCSQRCFFTSPGNCSAENSGAVPQQGPVPWVLCVSQAGGEPMRGSSPELNAAKSEFFLTGVASGLVPGLCTAGEAGLAALGGRTFSEHPGVVEQHLRVLFSEVGLLEYPSQRQ